MWAIDQQRPSRRLRDLIEHGFFHELGIPALVASLVLFVCAMTLLGANVSELRAAYARVQQTNEALLQIATINTDMLRVEMVVRGYALSGDPVYLAWLKESRSHVGTRLRTLHAMVQDDAVLAQKSTRLQSLLNQHGDYFDHLAKRVVPEREAVIAEIVDYGKKVKRRPIEDQFTALRNDLMRILADKQHETEARVVGAYRYAIGISTIALLLGAFGFAIVIHDRRRPA